MKIGEINVDDLIIDEMKIDEDMYQVQQLQQKANLTDAEMTVLIDYYKAQLKTAYYRSLNRNQAERQKAIAYKNVALKPVHHGNRDYYPFAPYNKTRSAMFTVTTLQSLTIILILLGMAFAIYMYSLIAYLTILSAISLLYFVTIVIATIILGNLLFHGPQEESIPNKVVNSLGNKFWPTYTILCPLYKEVEVVTQFVNAMADIDYPPDRLQVLFLTEESDPETRQAIINMHLPNHFRVITVPEGMPRTKPRACNFGLLNASGEYAVIYDAEDVPDPLQLKKAVLTFLSHDGDLACVQAKLNFYNADQNLLTRFFTLEYTYWFNIVLPGMQQLKMSLPLGGTSNHFRMSSLREIGAWDPFNVTEDCDLGLRLASLGLRTVVLDSITFEEANSSWSNWIRQRSRWIKGYMQTFLVYSRSLHRMIFKGQLREVFSLIFIIGASPATFFVNPVMWLLLAIYFGFGIVVKDFFYVLFPPSLLYISALCLLFGNILNLGVVMLAAGMSFRHKLIPFVLLLPLYWGAMCLAAIFGGIQLIVKPHYWEKTKHGLHLKSQNLASGTD